MSHHILVDRPRPACVLTTHPARAHSEETDVAKTWEQHMPIDCRDDYELTDQDHHLSMIGGFK